MTHRSQIEIFENIEHQHDHQTAAGRLVGGHAIAAIGGPQRIDRLGFTGRQVGHGDQPAMGLHVGVDTTRDLAMIEIIDAVLRDPSIGATHIGVAQQLAHLARLAIGPEVDLCRGRAIGQHPDAFNPSRLRRLHPETVHMRAHCKARLAIADRRLEHVGQRTASKTTQRLIESLDCERRGHRLITDLVDCTIEHETETIIAFADDPVLPHVGASRQRRTAVKVDEGMHVTLRQVDVHRTETGNAAHLRVDRRLHQGRANGGVNDIAAGGKNIEAGFNRLGLRCTDHGSMHYSDLQTKSVAVFDNMTRSGACEMGTDDQRRCAGQPAEDFAAGPGRLLGVVISTRRPGRPGKLAGMMNEVAGDQGVLALRGDRHADMPRRVPDGRYQADLIADLKRGIDQIDQSGIKHRLDRIVENRHLIGYIALALPVVELGTGHEIARIRKGRHPLPVDPHGVPADMIDMQVGAHHRVDRFTREAGLRQVAKERSLQVVPAGKRPILLVIAKAGINDDAPRWRLDDQRVDAHLEPPFVIHEVGLHPFDFAAGLAGCLRQDETRTADRLDFKDLGDGHRSNAP